MRKMVATFYCHCLKTGMVMRRDWQQQNVATILRMPSSFYPAQNSLCPEARSANRLRSKNPAIAIWQPCLHNGPDVGLVQPQLARQPRREHVRKF